MRILLGVSGGIAAYKAVLLLRLLREAGHQVRNPDQGGAQVRRQSHLEALSGEPNSRSVFHDVPGVEHVALGQGADLIIVAPATADLLARAACGRADDLLTASLLTAHCPVVMAPAMHTEMWLHPATQANVATLRSRGVHIIEPDSGRLTGADSGPGRLPDPERIMAEALSVVNLGETAVDEAPAATAQPDRAPTSVILRERSESQDLGRNPHREAPEQPLAGRRVVITAGGTREPIDPVRWIGNRSTGMQGIALAQVAAGLGADVSLIAANIDDALLAEVSDVDVVRVETTAQLRDAVLAEQPAADVIIMAAAVADYRPAKQATSKIKKPRSDASLTAVAVDSASPTPTSSSCAQPTTPTPASCAQPTIPTPSSCAQPTAPTPSSCAQPTTPTPSSCAQPTTPTPSSCAQPTAESQDLGINTSREAALTIQLVENPDVLAELVSKRRPGQVIVGFAAETGDATGSVLDHGRAKALRKGADLLAVNAVGENLGFGTPDNEVWLLDDQGAEVGHTAGSKTNVAEGILRAAATAIGV